jgi:hypothetical protein
MAVMARPTGDLHSISLQGEGTSLGRFERVDTVSWGSCGGEEGGSYHSKAAVKHEVFLTKLIRVRESTETEADINL